MYSSGGNSRKRIGCHCIKNGCGTGLLVDWAIVWMHLNYKSKAVILLDADKEGIEAKRLINEARDKYKKKNYKLKALLLQPTEDMKIVNHKIKNSIIITVEHLLSYEFWEKIKGNDWVEEKNRTEILNMFENVMDIRKFLDSVIDELIDNKDMKETIIYLMPKDDKKDKILKLVQSEVENGNVSVIEGFSNTILELEKQFS